MFGPTTSSATFFVRCASGICQCCSRSLLRPSADATPLSPVVQNTSSQFDWKKIAPLGNLMKTTAISRLQTASRKFLKDAITRSFQENTRNNSSTEEPPSSAETTHILEFVQTMIETQGFQPAHRLRERGGHYEAESTDLFKRLPPDHPPAAFCRSRFARSAASMKLRQEGGRLIGTSISMKPVGSTPPFSAYSAFTTSAVFFSPSHLVESSGCYFSKFANMHALPCHALFSN